MAFEANYREITVNRICDRQIVTEMTEADAIVPDVQGDIGKVLLVKSSCGIDATRREAERTTVNGTVRVTLLYRVAEDGSLGTLRVALPFSHTVRTEEGTFAELEAQVGEVSWFLYHSRKVNVKASVELRRTVSRMQSCRVLAECPEHSEVTCRTVTATDSFVAADRVLAIRERTELSGSLPDIDRLLFWEGAVRDPQVQLMTDKAMIRGEMVLSFFYYSIEGTPEYAEHVIPFSEVVEAEGVTEEMEERSTMTLSELEMRAGEDSDGDIRTLYLDGKLAVSIRAFSESEQPAAEDLFSTEYELDCDTQTVEYTREIAGPSLELPVREAVLSEESEISEIVLMEVRASLHGAVASERKTKAEGICFASFLYRDGDGEYHGMDREIPFGAELDGVYSAAEIRVRCGRFSYHLNNAHEVELRGNIYIEETAAKTVALECVSDARVRGGAEEAPSLILCFPTEEDTLWSVAKRYRVTRESIISGNQLSGETLRPGQRLIIAR